MDYIDTWGLYQCFQGTDDEMVASDCREEFFALQPNGKVFQCISSHEGMMHHFILLKLIERKAEKDIEIVI